MEPLEAAEPVDISTARETSSPAPVGFAPDPAEATRADAYELTDPGDEGRTPEPGPSFQAEPLEPERAGLDAPPPPGSPESAAFSRLGPEVLARLRARYAEIMARIAERPLEEDLREQLKQRAERLNPDSWVTADEVAQALEVYENVYDGLRAVVGHPHRRRRRGRKGRGDAPDAQV